MPGTYFLVDPDGRFSWEHSWDSFLQEDETIDTRQWTIWPMNPGSPETPVLSNAQSNVVFVEGMLKGRIYHLAEAVVTNNGVRDTKRIILRSDLT